MREPNFERRASAENYRDDGNLAARQSIWSYAEPSPSPLEFLPPDGRDRVLDVGCGNGVWLDAVLQQQVQPLLLAGLDLSAGMLVAARQRLGSVPLVQADAVQLPIASASLDVVLAMWMLYHLDDLEGGIAELRRVLRSDGSLLAITVGADHMAALSELMTEALCHTIGHVETDDWLPPFRFNADDAPGQLAWAFSEVDSHIARRRLSIPESGPILDYLTSLRGPAELALGRELPWPEVVSAIEEQVDGVIRRQGAFLAEGVTGVFVCRH